MVPFIGGFALGCFVTVVLRGLRDLGQLLAGMGFEP